MSPTPAVFDLTAPLPTGTVVLEASAGTGKTYTIAALTARYLAEGRAEIGDILLVTFSRAATAELRSKVRERLASSWASLDAALRGGGPAPSDGPSDGSSAGPADAPLDAVDALLADAPRDELERRCDRLAAALTHFDSATIMTTHEFCHGMLRGLGVLAAQEPQSQLVDDLAGFADEASADLYLQRYSGGDPGARPRYFDRGAWNSSDGEAGLRSLARRSIETEAAIAPLDASGAAAQRVAFATQVRSRVSERMRRARVFSFNEQLTRLRDALLDPDYGPRARAKLAQRFPLVLIDEFQDTDPVQWQIIERAFAGRDGSEVEGAALVLIGDPKQAIYRFRGADVHTYTRAASTASSVTTLGTNFRSDARVVDAVSALFRPVALGDAIATPPVSAAHGEPRLRARPGTPWACGVQVRVIERSPGHTLSMAARIERDLVGVVGTLLGPDAPLRHPSGAPLAASDVAVLVRSNKRGSALAQALTRAGIPATFAGADSVLTCDAAGDWLTLLRALDDPRRPFTQRAVLTDFVGADVEELALAGDERWAQWSAWLHTWAATLRRDGVWALVAAIDADTRLSARLLSTEGGERTLTDLRHVAELLHREATRHGRSLPDLITWLAESSSDRDASGERTRRLETDDDAVSIMTIHRAKGLQFPVVLLPEPGGREKVAGDDGGAVVLPAGDGRVLDLSDPRQPERRDRWRSHLVEEGDEDLRGLYVALTRAQSHVVAWWAGGSRAATSPLHRLLQAGDAARSSGTTTPQRPDLAYDPKRLPGEGSPLRMSWLAEDGVAVVATDEATAAPAASRGPRTRALAARSFTREIDADWRRTSYSGLTAQAHADAAAASLSGLTVVDEPEDAVWVDADPALAMPSPMADLPGGTSFGTLVHAIYEYTDARGDDWRAVLSDEVAAATRRWPVADVGAGALADALAPTFETPLGPLGEGTTLRSFGPRDKLAELDFEFALDAPQATLAEVADLLARHLPDPGSPTPSASRSAEARDPGATGLGATDLGALLADYPSHLASPTLTGQRLVGFLTGSIDAVLRLPSGAHLIVDYKTNRLGGRLDADETLTLGHYAPRPMAEAMMASHYPLQALLYSVALHRYLSARLPHYDPDRHLAGTAYLFVRGMAGADTPLVDGHPTGVFTWRPPTALVRELSTLLAGGLR